MITLTALRQRLSWNQLLSTTGQELLGKENAGGGSDMEEIAGGSHMEEIAGGGSNMDENAGGGSNME